MRENVNHLIAAYRNYVRKEYVCSLCPSKLWNALQAIKEFYQRIKKTWEEKNAEEDVRAYVTSTPHSPDRSDPTHPEK